MLLLCWVVAAAWSVRPSAGAHGDNMGCIGCAITMEHAFEKVARYANERGMKMSLTEQATEEVNMAELFHGSGRRSPSTCSTLRVGSTATEMTTRWSNVMAVAYAGDEPVETDVYNKTHFVCVKQLDYCDDQPVHFHVTLFNDKCEACKAVVADIAMVVYRRKRGGNCIAPRLTSTKC